ncbi:adenylyltransferase and sulfurtransferase [Natronincola peptidivorans]|uniref:Adenylyltransferase and sulfurtransferase n=1 Tax=Natronincola peptidivorans TaxID=426128 RepID=A0A1I0CYU3_9FIRM|nr:ThiF family adenylyltransferase [Natronincola peptidivorans]SET24515.1 adenylyltransferase and sulfurtransferase [Natronincola peptidivorans]
MEERYLKQINFEGIGIEGQKLLKNAKVLLVGCGALGTVAANSLARAGVGYLRIVDRDFVELSNLHRQTLFDEEDIKNNIPKAEAAARKLRKINSDIEIDSMIKDVNSVTVEKMVEDIDLIIDCTDNFKTRYLINDVAFSKNIPWIYGGAIGSAGNVKFFLPEDGVCLRCMMEVPPPAGSTPTCDTSGVINTITGIVAMMQVNEAIKYLTNNTAAIEKKLVFIDLWENVIEKIELTQRESCPCCIEKSFIYLQDKRPEAVHICGNNSIQVDFQEKINNIETIYKRLKDAGIEVKLTPFLLSIKADGYQIKVFDDGRAIIKNAKTVEEAKTIYAKYIGY